FRNNSEDPEIADLVKKGYIIRTRADSDTKEARKNDYTHFEAAKKSGAQVITTDYYLPSTLFSSPYQIKYDDGTYVRVNPVNGIE
ncbi:MAG: Ca2+-dependent phosphoinositide-specific phospholipase C, partial [Flavobacterium sp.]